MSEKEYRALINRQRRLPAMIDRAHRNLAMLEREALRYGMRELVREVQP